MSASTYTPERMREALKLHSNSDDCNDLDGITLPAFLDDQKSPCTNPFAAALDYDQTPPPETPKNIEITKEMLKSISPECVRHVWRQVVWSVLALGWNCSERLAHDWSTGVIGRRDCDKFNESDFNDLVRDFDPTKGISYRTLVHHAKEFGYAGNEFNLRLSVQPPADGKFSSPWDNPAALKQMLRHPPEPFAWLINERIPLGRGILLTGIGGSSKTRMLYHLAIGSIVGEVPWEWEIDSTGKSILIVTEDTINDVHHTLHNTCKALNLSDKQIDKICNHLIIYPLAGQDIKLLATSAVDKSLVKTTNFQSLLEKITDIADVVFIGIDPALSITTGDELDQGHQRALGKMADDLAVQTGATVCLVSHATKASQHTDELSSHNSRGGGAITDAVRAEFVVRTMTPSEGHKSGITDTEERKRHLQLVATKGNHLPPSAFVPIWLRRGDYGELHSSDVVFDEAQQKATNFRVQRAYEILTRLCKSSQPKLIEWRQACIDGGLIPSDTKDSGEQAMNRIKSQLKVAKKISSPERGVWVVAE